MYKKLLLSVVFVFSVSILWSQAIQISKKRVTENGKTYFLHKVKKGQTLYSISKAYGVEINDIVFENPDLLDGIRKGQVLKIPAIDKDARHQKKHIVKKGETIYSICKAYHITEQALYQANISLRKNGLKAGETIVIPLKDFSGERHSFAKATPSDSTIHHKVQPKETLYSLTKRYGITTEMLYAANPSLQESGLKAGETIVIPQKHHAKSAETPSTPIDSSIIALMDTAFHHCDTTHFLHPNIQMLIAIPFANNDFEKTQEIEIDFTDFNNLKSYPYLEFYEGILLAIDSLKKTGLSFDITVVNSRDTAKLINAVKQAPDIFIGPIDAKAYKAILPYKTLPKLWIEPFKANPHINTANYYTLLPAGQKHLSRLANYVKQQDSATCIVVSSPLYRDTATANAIYRDWYHHSVSSQNDFLVKKLPNSHKPLKEVENALSVGRKNFVIFFTDNEPEVAEFISKLRLSSDDYDIHILILPSWKQFDLNTEYLHRLQALKANPYYIDYQNYRIRNFIKTYDSFFHTMPSRFSFWGFDLTFYFSKATGFFGTKDLNNCLPVFNHSLLETKFHFIPQPHPQNDYLFILDYAKDFSIQVIP